MKKDLLKLGVTSADYGDCTMQIFDRDRLICDCIFNENKMDRETYNKAIQGYVADPQKNMEWFALSCFFVTCLVAFSPVDNSGTKIYRNSR